MPTVHSMFVFNVYHLYEGVIVMFGIIAEYIYRIIFDILTVNIYISGEFSIHY